MSISLQVETTLRCDQCQKSFFMIRTFYIYHDVAKVRKMASIQGWHSETKEIADIEPGNDPFVDYCPVCWHLRTTQNKEGQP